jgi:hypothetical protein
MLPSNKFIKEEKLISYWLLITFILLGLILIIISGEPFDWNIPTFWKDFLRELGIVLIAVFSVSFLYELFLARRYLDQFREHINALSMILNDQWEQGESNARMCSRLGIREIFPTRDSFESKYPISNWMNNLTKDSTLFVVGQTLFQMMTNVKLIKAAISNGAHLQFCITNPEGVIDLANKIAGVQKGDFISSMSVFRNVIRKWLVEQNPSGQIELRFHDLPLVDSYIFYKSPTNNFTVLEFNLGRAVTDKCILYLDSDKSLGTALSTRFKDVWESFDKTIFQYDGSKVVADHLDEYQ